MKPFCDQPVRADGLSHPTFSRNLDLLRLRDARSVRGGDPARLRGRRRRRKADKSSRAWSRGAYRGPLRPAARSRASTLFWVNRFALTMYEKAADAAGRDVPRQARRRLPADPSSRGRAVEMTAAIGGRGYRALKPSWGRGHRGQDLPACSSTCFRHKAGAGRRAGGRSSPRCTRSSRGSAQTGTYNLLLHKPGLSGLPAYDDHHRVHPRPCPELEALLRQMMVLHKPVSAGTASACA